ncbi:esterase/lipase family protein [Marilutibacter alkalisoli]|uniref:Alpha/beta hydrolase n=1 Tax=Marilutibacter alkalisoli TaxID=2591633 RepID=A0A514BWU2_9GAMM|nr:alpha/beta hydrolase [Lysobacter alkalisoli]
MRGLSMRWLAHRFRKAGFDTELFDYASVLGEPEAAGPRLAARLARGPVHVVAHSLGGLLVMDTLKRHPGLPVGRVVCLGSPLCGSGVARDAARRSLRLLTVGRSAALLQRGCPELPAGVEVGMVAGDLPLGLGQLFGRVDGPHDGTVALAETRPPGLRDHVVIHASHTGLLFSAEAARQGAHFLAHGRFAPVALHAS